MSIASSLLTVDEFSKLDDTDGLELVDGVVEEVAMGAESAKLAHILTRAVDDYAAASRAGIVLPNEVGIDLRPLGRELLRRPDGMFVRRGRLPGNRPPKGWLEVVPDIAWEVVSPNDTVERLEQKLADYRQAGVSLVWVVYPATRTARIERPDGRVQFIDENGYLDGEEVLPGFRLRLGDLFTEYEAEIAALDAAERETPASGGAD
jgi:Uma2 family endonuclease